MSSRSSNRSKNKKSVQTALGKASNYNNADLIDLSHLRKPIDTSLFGLTQILSLFETATDEVRRYIAYECEIMFECRICRTVFRSLANFILHKRNYCRDNFSPIRNNKSDFEKDLEIINEDENKLKEQIAESDVAQKRYPKRNLSLVLKKLSDKQECQKISENVLNEELSEKSYLQENNEDASLNTVYLERINSNKDGVFQTMNPRQTGGDLMKSEVMEIHSILNTNEAILGADGKIFSFKTDISDTARQKLICTICNIKFATKKTLTHHIKYKHNDTRVVYICPECKDTFANAWCVFRHLYKIHRKTSTQIRRMRDQIHSSAIVRKQEYIKKKTSIQLDEDNENQWANEVQYPNDSQFCEGCGKKFERKAALNSHVQMCSKRLLVCNTTKENQKTNQEEKMGKQIFTAVKGSSKRKPGVLKKIIRRSNSLEVMHENEDNKDCIANVKENIDTEIQQECIDSNKGTVADDRCISTDVTTIVKDAEYKKCLIQEIIFGSRGPNSAENSVEASASKNYIEFVSDEEEILGFLKGSDVLSTDSATNNKIHEETTQSKIECEESRNKVFSECIKNSSANLENFPDKELEENNSIKSDILKVNNEREIIEDFNEETLNEFPRAYAPKQYFSRKSKINSLLKSINNDRLCVSTLNEELNEESKMNCNTDNINISTDNIDLPYALDTSDITVAAQYDVQGVHNVVYSSDSESCTCFDDRSSDSSVSFGSNKNDENDEELKKAVNLEENLCFDDSNSQTMKPGKKRKNSTESKRNEVSDSCLRNKCENYVDYSNFSCKPCSIAFTTDNDLIKHMSLHFNWFRYKCSKCNFLSYDKASCKEHECMDNIGLEQDNFVTPIPYWKTIHMATSFNPVIEDSHLINFSENDDSLKETDCNLMHNVSKINAQNPSLRNMIMEVIFGTQDTVNNPPAVSSVNARPIRNRTTVQSLQKDFEYNMKEVDSEMKKTITNKVKPIKIVKNETNFCVINMNTSEKMCKKKRTY